MHTSLHNTHDKLATCFLLVNYVSCLSEIFIHYLYSDTAMDNHFTCACGIYLVINFILKY